VARGVPVIDLHAPDRLEMDLPVGVEEGRGEAHFHASWNPATLVSVVCKGFSTEQDLSGVIAPTTHMVHTTTRFALDHGRIVGRPELRRDRMPMAFDLDAGSWDKVRQVFVEQDKLGRCSVGIDPDAMVDRIRQLGVKGIHVRLPERVVPAFHLPVFFVDSYDEGDVRVAVMAYQPEIVVR